jgi:glycosyltransferase involved in cell wall biosynthesis
LRIAIIAPLEIRVPPVAYGGTELVVSLLAEGLVKRGHDVTLFASGDSLTLGRLVSTTEFALKGSGRDTRLLTMMNVVSCLERADEFDIIHNHTIMEGMVASSLVKTPMVTTFHNLLVGDELSLFERYRGWHTTVSRSYKERLPPKDRFAGVVYNAINCSSYPYNGGERDDFLLYHSRICPEKGAHIAIRVARRLGLPLVISGKVDEPGREYFLREVFPYIDGKMVRFEAETGQARKRELLSRARCLLAPIVWPEPFGLFMTEAMACGTPVVALDYGAAAEVVAHGETGFVVKSEDAMVDAVRHLDVIEPRACRRRVEERFDHPVMTENYLRVYNEVLSEEGRGSRPVSRAKVARDGKLLALR